MAAEQFSLCWDNFHSNMSNGLSSLLKSEDLVDVTLAAEGRYLKAHKMVLSVCSPYFRELFQVNPCKHPIVFLKDVSFTALNNLLEFMYQGEVKVSQDDLGTFIKTAEALKIKGLTGEGSSQNDTENDTSVQTNSYKNEHTPTPNRKSTREKSPPARKKMLGPASKRFKPADNESPTPQQQSQPPVLVTNKQQQQPQTPDTKDGPPEPQHIMHFKMEPEETAVSLQNEDDLHNQYEDSTMDDIGMDSTTDYMLDTTDPIDVKAGTSTATDNTEPAGENQANLVGHHIAQSSRSRCAICYQRMVAEKGRNYAQRFCKRVRQKCFQCQKYMCPDCFFIIHSDSSIHIKYFKN